VPTKTGVVRKTAAPAMVSGATPRGRPMHHAVSSTNANQPRLNRGESTSESNADIPKAWKSPEFWG
jgi:hypothetical protein